MTSEQLDAKYSQLTGLRFKISNLVADAGEDAEKLQAAYNHVMWHIKNGLIRKVDGIKELVEEVIPALQEAFGQPSTAEIIEESETETETNIETQTETQSETEIETPTESETESETETGEETPTESETETQQEP